MTDVEKMASAIRTLTDVIAKEKMPKDEDEMMKRETDKRDQFTTQEEALDRAKKYMEKGHGALVGFELKDGVDAGKKFIDSLKLFYHVANIGDARSLAIHPSSTTHSQLSEDEKLAAGVTPGYIRLSIGIEHIDDLLEDLEQALNNS